MYYYNQAKIQFIHNTVIFKTKYDETDIHTGI